MSTAAWRRLISRDWGKNVYVAKSGLRDAGDGLFARRPFAASEIVAEYVGCELTKKELDEKYGTVTAEYAIQIGDDEYLDTDPSTCTAAKANNFHWLNSLDCKDGCNNAEFVLYQQGKEKKLFVRTTREVAEDAEIFVNYGCDFWQARPPNKVANLLDAIYAAGIKKFGYDTFKRRELLTCAELRGVYGNLYDGKDLTDKHCGGYASLSSLVTRAHTRNGNAPIVRARNKLIFQVNKNYKPYDRKLLRQFQPKTFCQRSFTERKEKKFLEAVAKCRVKRC